MFVVITNTYNNFQNDYTHTTIRPQKFHKCYENLEICKLLWPMFMAYPHCCTCTDSPIMSTGSNQLKRQLKLPFDSCQ